MQIQIIATSVETKPTAKGSYQQLEVTFKNLTFNKTESKKIMSFGEGATAFKALADAPPGSTWDITVVKNSKGFNDWTAVVPASGASKAESRTSAASSGYSESKPAMRSTYETPEERAQRQVLIVRQSSLSNAVATLAVGAKSLKPEDVLALAEQYNNWVFQVKDPGPSGFEDLPDFDIPKVD